MLALKVIAVIVVLILALGTFLRVRKLRRDEMRALSKPVERRLMTPPPSPYAPSKGFRLLDGAGEPLARPPVERPRLDPEHPYVFGDSLQHTDDFIGVDRRHDDDWFLSRSSNRSSLATLLRRLFFVALLAAAVALVATYYVHHHDAKTPKSSSAQTTTTVTNTTTTSTTTTLALPTSFTALTTSGDDAVYAVPRSSYDVSVSGTNGATWVVYDMGPQNTLEYQGTVAQGATKSLKMTGGSHITIGSPSSATVAVDGVAVNFPSPLPPTLILVFRAARPSSSS